MQGVFLEPPLLTEKQQMKADPNSSSMERSLLQELGKERRQLTEQEKPRMKPARTVCKREGNRTSSMAGSRSCTPLPQGAGAGLKKATDNQFDEFKEANTVRGHSLKTPGTKATLQRTPIQEQKMAATGPEKSGSKARRARETKVGDRKDPDPRRGISRARSSARRKVKGSGGGRAYRSTVGSRSGARSSAG